MKNNSRRLILASTIILVFCVCGAILAFGAMRMAQAQRVRAEFFENRPAAEQQDPSAQSATPYRQPPLADPMLNLMQMLHGMMGAQAPQ